MFDVQCFIKKDKSVLWDVMLIDINNTLYLEH